MSKRKENLTGQTYGKLAVIRYVGSRKWECLCECGNEVEVYAQNLKSNHTKSCGCLKISEPTIGSVYGYLTLQEIVYRGNTRYCRCLCSCGKETSIRIDTWGTTKSCGHLLGSGTPSTKAKIFVDGTQPSKLMSEPSAVNKSGVVGVNWDRSRGKWQASIRFKGHRYNLGRFDDIEDAITARKEAEEKYFKPYIDTYKK